MSCPLNCIVLSNLSSQACWRVRSQLGSLSVWLVSTGLLSSGQSASKSQLVFSGCHLSTCLAQVLDHQTADKPATFLSGEYICCFLLDPEPELLQENQRLKNLGCTVVFSTLGCNIHVFNSVATTLSRYMNDTKSQRSSSFPEHLCFQKILGF